MILMEENFDTEVVKESDSGGKPRMYLQGVMAEAEEKNRNGRIYDLKEMQAACDLINTSAAGKRHILGECDHPNTLEIKLENVSHRLMEARMEGNRLICKAEILSETPKGAILASLVNSGVQVGVSTRGAGQVNESSGKVTNFRFITVDAVATPSCRSAYPETIQEQVEMYSRGEIITDLAEAQAHDPLAQAYFQIEMRKFIDSLRG
jgi:hypothetical protein